LIGATSGLVSPYVGRLSPEKRPDLFIAAARELARRCPAARFTLIGGGMLAERARLHVHQAGLDDRCVVAGVRHDTEDVYGAIDLLLLCSDTEGTPRVILEAQARRVPVVARAVGDMPCLVRDGRNGILVTSSDPCALADAAWRLLSDPSLRSAVANAAVAGVLREYTVERMAEEIDCVYRELRPSSQGWTQATPLGSNFGE
jgi:glycosyltransferase involved in cell wall biosynthesis